MLPASAQFQPSLLEILFVLSVVSGCHRQCFEVSRFAGVLVQSLIVWLGPVSSPLDVVFPLDMGNLCSGVLLRKDIGCVSSLSFHLIYDQSLGFGLGMPPERPRALHVLSVHWRDVGNSGKTRQSYRDPLCSVQC